MKLLYYTWNEWMKKDVVESLEDLGHRVEVVRKPASEDPAEEERISKRLRGGFDAVFTMDYFPMLSRICNDLQIPYLSWISDCPHLPLYSDTIRNSCNRIFSFDLYQTTELLRRGAKARYLPLGVNCGRLKKQLSGKAEVRYGLSFVGSLYQDEHNYLDRIEGLPDRLKGYLDGLIEAQLLFYGYDLIGETLGEKELLELAALAPVKLGEEYEEDPADIYRDWIRKKVTVTERERMLSLITKKHPLFLASPGVPDSLRNENLHELGYVDYYEQMPYIFAGSRINLNLTLRSIRHGIPLRVVDILGAGGFLLTNYQPDFDNYFRNGRELVWFESPEDLLEKIDYYLEHDEERQRIAEKGREAAAVFFDYEKLLTELIRSS